MDDDHDFDSCLPLVEAALAAQRDEEAKAATIEGIYAQSEAMTLGADFWKDLLAQERERKRRTPKDQQIREVSASIPRRLVSDLQSRHARNALARMRD